MTEEIKEEKINKTPEEPLEQQVEFELTKDNDKEKITIHSTEELISALKEGFSPKNIDEVEKLSEYFKVDVGKIQSELTLEELDKNLFSLNTERQLLYLENGKDAWFENVKNYWYNKDAYNFDYHKRFTNLEKQLFDVIYHRGISVQLGDRATKIFPYLVEDIVIMDNTLKENILKNIRYKKGEDSTKPKYKCPDYLTPRDKKTKDYHPLLIPFRDTLTQLENQGIKELPDWLREQGEMAGCSAVYQDTIETVQLLAEKTGKDASIRMREFAIIEKKIHKEQPNIDTSSPK